MFYFMFFAYIASAPSLKLGTNTPFSLRTLQLPSLKTHLGVLCETVKKLLDREEERANNFGDDFPRHWDLLSSAPRGRFLSLINSLFFQILSNKKLRLTKNEVF